jgi:formate hydrogenlyase subunit 6/NADH:ubiquinone oxidoreductase subunit I
MNTKGWRLTRAELTEWLAGLTREGKRLVAPVEDAAGLRCFKIVDSVDQVSFAAGKTRWSPKEFLFPKTETLFSYAVTGNDVKIERPPADETEQVIVGVRPCDAAGLARLDGVFLRQSQAPDAHYAGHRNRSTIVSITCESAEPECFCTAVGVGPAAEDGSDVQLVATPNGWIVRPITAKGEALTTSLSSRPVPSSDEWAKAQATAAGVAASLKQNPIAHEWAAVLEKSFDQPLWQAVGQNCLGCSICSYVCPSCSCFDVQDSGNAWCGDRCRSWDSCTFGLFTRHGSGHNPRGNQPARFRQRVLHKFSYFPETHDGQFMCVGCGRCVALCPVGMNIQGAVQQVVGASQEGSNARS